MEMKGQLISSSSYSSSEALQRELCPRIRLERVQELLEKQRALQQVLSLRLKELRRVCMQEAELTGKLPPEYPLEPGEKPQFVRRRPAPAYWIPATVKNEEATSLEELAQELALQQQVVEAARRLAVAPELTAEQRRRRRQVQADAAQRLRELEIQVVECRVRLGKGAPQRSNHDEAFHSESSSLSESASHENDDPHGFHSSKAPNPQGPFPDRPSPPKARDHLRAISSSPDRRPGWRVLQPDLYNEAKDRRNSVASPTRKCLRGWGLRRSAVEIGVDCEILARVKSCPNRTLPRSVSSFEGRSVPATPVLARNACGVNHQFRSEAPALHPRQWSGSHDSQLGPPSRLYTECWDRCWGGGEHLSRRDGPSQLEWAAFPESPSQRRARPAARTKSCGPLLPPQSREVGYGPPLAPHRNFHKALALEGLRDWYLRNAGVGQRGAPERRGPAQSVHQQLRSYCEPVPPNSEMGYYGGQGGLPHSLSYAGQPLYGRPFGELLYADDSSSSSYALDATEHPAPGTLV
uniref:Uncharacterized protein n=1 Tax=Sphaerodactylus townsendi TaxID=933632 RepID=A0ACB8ENI4_9SAUR